MWPATWVVINTASRTSPPLRRAPHAPRCPHTSPLPLLPPSQHSLGHTDWIKLRHGCCGSDPRLVLSPAFCAAAIKLAILVQHLLVLLVALVTQKVILVAICYKPRADIDSCYDYCSIQLCPLSKLLIIYTPWYLTLTISWPYCNKQHLYFISIHLTNTNNKNEHCQ